MTRFKITTSDPNDVFGDAISLGDYDQINLVCGNGVIRITNLDGVYYLQHVPQFGLTSNMAIAPQDRGSVSLHV
jgi:hypothetical protein